MDDPQLFEVAYRTGLWHRPVTRDLSLQRLLGTSSGLVIEDEFVYQQTLITVLILETYSCHVKEFILHLTSN